MIWSEGGFLYIVISVFFFQAEDGIRDLVRSRGLGDVYKRQGHGDVVDHVFPDRDSARRGRHRELEVAHARGNGPVSYTHLTLPTSDLV